MCLVEPVLIVPLRSLTSLRFSGKVRLSSLQLEVVLTAIGKENRMKILNISSNDLSSVNPFLISSLGKLLSLNVSRRRLTTVQLEMLITGIEKENRMEILNIAQNDLSFVNLLLISFLGKLLNVNVSHSKLTTAQLEILIIAIEKESVMINIVINGNDLSHLSLSSFVSLLNSLENLEMNYTKVTKVQVYSIREAISDGTMKTKMKQKSKLFILASLIGQAPRAFV